MLFPFTMRSQDPSTSSEGVQWLYLDLNSFFASCEQQDRPELRGKPVAVVAVDTDTTAAIAASYEAKAFGVKTGTMIRDAKRMCPGLILVSARHRVYVEYHHRIIDAVESRVPVRSVMSIDEMACELTGSQCELSAARALAIEVKRTVQARAGECLRSSVGLAPNPFLAKVASDRQKPDGLTVLLKNNLPGPLAPLGVRELPGIGAAMEARLHRQAIRTVGQLYACSKPEMRQIWGGIVGERYYEWLRGENLRLAPSQTRSLSHQHVLEPGLRAPERALPATQKLVVRVAARLRSQGYYARTMALSIKLIPAGRGGEAAYWERARDTGETQDTITFLHTLGDLWREFREEVDPRLKILRVGITLFGLVPEGQHQLSFFEKPERAELMRIMDKVHERYGSSSLQVGSLLDLDPEVAARQPKIAFQRVPGLEEFE